MGWLIVPLPTPLPQLVTTLLREPSPGTCPPWKAGVLTVLIYPNVSV